jgi:ribosomal protein L21E
MAFQEPKKWCKWLTTAEWWYNSSYHTAIKTSPFEALYEYRPPLLQDLSIPDSASPETHNTLHEKSVMLQTLQQNLMQAQRKMKKYADLNRTPRTFQVGDMVYLKVQPHIESALGQGHSLKLSSRFYGPFRVTQKVGQSAYNLLLPDDTKIHNVFHVNQLKKHIGNRSCS